MKYDRKLENVYQSSNFLSFEFFENYHRDNHVRAETRLYKRFRNDSRYL